MKSFIRLLNLSVCFILVSASFLTMANATNPIIVTETVTDVDQYHYCHRCGMAVHKSKEAITVTNVTDGPWYQCCPMCALLDVIETGNGSGTITAYGHLTHEKSEIVIKDNTLQTVTPPHAVVLAGGSCKTNLFFTSKDNALKYVAATPDASPDMVKPIQKVFTKLSKKKKNVKNCSVCSTKMDGHENTFFSIITKEKKRIIACCGHCGLFASWKLGDKFKRGLTTDFKTGKKIDAQKAYYVVNNDMVICCFPSTISFANKGDALQFQKEHGGKVMSYSEALGKIKTVMKGDE